MYRIFGVAFYDSLVLWYPDSVLGIGLVLLNYAINVIFFFYCFYLIIWRVNGKPYNGVVVDTSKCKTLKEKV